ncbi:hypothetical protein OS122_02605 [Mycolicibacterium mucogenicum]|uniref:hypothetical protein n=1 Tax=Mycolicibacterium mucogenicum TaxID=56689 RepID=UPI00226A6446|nr:hypothetical protein [Mycolicibacterium mucogenicum]MCX8559790.1 hypothetical protein [Mycolicibacterium mucogenicum]
MDMTLHHEIDADDPMARAIIAHPPDGVRISAQIGHHKFELRKWNIAVLGDRRILQVSWLPVNVDDEGVFHEFRSLINKLKEHIVSNAQSTVDTAVQLIEALGGVLTQFETAVTNLQNDGVNTDALATAVQTGQAALQTAQDQLNAINPPAPQA